MDESYVHLHAVDLEDLLKQVNFYIKESSRDGIICRLVTVYYNSDRHYNVAIIAKPDIIR